MKDTTNKNTSELGLEPISGSFPIGVAWSFGAYGVNHLHIKGSERTICGMKEFDRQYTVFEANELPKYDQCKRCFKNYR